jgi:hypothetical protein
MDLKIDKVTSHEIASRSEKIEKVEVRISGNRLI